MSRRNKAVKRPVPPDARYDSQTVSKFINNLMFEGKKSDGRGHLLLARWTWSKSARASPA